MSGELRNWIHGLQILVQVNFVNFIREKLCRKYDKTLHYAENYGCYRVFMKTVIQTLWLDVTY